MKAKLEIEMPEGCYDCQFCAGIECGVVEGMPTIDLFGEEGLMPKWCPLIPEEIMDGKLLTGWIPVSERIPRESEYTGLSNGQHYMKRLEIAYMTDTIEYAIGYYDGYKWMDKRHEKIINAVAWKRHEPYKPGYHPATGRERGGR